MIVKCVKAAYNKYATSGTNKPFYGGNYLLSLFVIISAKFDVAWTRCDVSWHFVTSVGVVIEMKCMQCMRDIFWDGAVKQTLL